MKSLLSLIATTLLLLTANQASAVDSKSLTEKLSYLFNQDIEEGLILSFQEPYYVDSYQDSDEAHVHLFKVLFEKGEFGEGGFNLGGNEETIPTATSYKSVCEYIKYIEVEDDFTYGGPCTQKLEDVTDGALFDEGLVGED